MKKFYKGDYDNYINNKIELIAASPMGKSIKEGKASYYVIEDERKIDFVIYNDDNYMTLDVKSFLNKNEMDIIFEEIKKDYSYVNIFVPIEDEETIKYIIDNYDTSVSDIIQNDYKYKKITFKL